MAKRLKVFGGSFVFVLALFVFGGYQLGKDMALRDNARDAQISAAQDSSR